MATVFMKWLETRPKDYDRGIQLLTLGKLRPLKEQIAHQYVNAGMRVLEIGCGTGTLTKLLVQRRAQVTAIDASPTMLAEAQQKLADANLAEFHQLDATLIADKFPASSFDLIVSTLVFSEFAPDTLRAVLNNCHQLLTPSGRLLIADEVVPERPLARLLYTLLRFPLVLLTWLLTRTSITPLRGFESLLTVAGFQVRRSHSQLGGSLVLYEAFATGSKQIEPLMVAPLRHQTTLRTLLLDLWATIFRILPPYPKVRPGLYRVGDPTHDSPVLVTGNFDLTVRRVVKEIDGRVDVWLLVADSAGINVWCGAGGGFFTAEKVLAAIKASRLDQVVNHRMLILPQLCANGVNGHKIHQAAGWRVKWGPVLASDIPAYLAAGNKTDDMRLLRFPLRDRLEMVTVTIGLYALMIMIPVYLFRRPIFWPTLISLLGISYFYAIVHIWLPGRDGLAKALPMTAITLAGLLLYTALWDPAPAQALFGRAMGISALSVFVSAELQGMSPLMRGEQANWGPEAIIFSCMVLIYWLLPLALGWR